LTAQSTGSGYIAYQTIDSLELGKDYEISFDVDFFEVVDSAPTLNFVLGDVNNTSQRKGISDVRGGGSTKSYTGTLTCYDKTLRFWNNRYVTSVPRFSGRIYNLVLKEIE